MRINTTIIRYNVVRRQNHETASSDFSRSFTLKKLLNIRSGLLTHCGRVTQICVFNTVKLGTYEISP